MDSESVSSNSAPTVPAVANAARALPAAVAPAPLLACMGDYAQYPPVALHKPVILIGSRDRCHICLESSTVSGAHALILNSGGTVYIRDLASHHHIFVNDHLTRQTHLRHRDIVRVGKFIFRFTNANDRTPELLPPPSWWIRVGAEPEPRVLRGRVVLIGRRAACDLVLPDEMTSAAHAVLFEMDGRRFVRDLHSRNGTTVNGREIKQHELAPGDRIQIGQTQVVYLADEANPAPLPTAAIDRLAEFHSESQSDEPQVRAASATPVPEPSSNGAIGAAPLPEPPTMDAMGAAPTPEPSVTDIGSAAPVPEPSVTWPEDETPRAAMARPAGLPVMAELPPPAAEPESVEIASSPSVPDWPEVAQPAAVEPATPAFVSDLADAIFVPITPDTWNEPSSAHAEAVPTPEIASTPEASPAATESTLTAIADDESSAQERDTPVSATDVPADGQQPPHGRSGHHRLAMLLGISLMLLAGVCVVVSALARPESIMQGVVSFELPKEAWSDAALTKFKSRQESLLLSGEVRGAAIQQLAAQQTTLPAGFLGQGEQRVGHLSIRWELSPNDRGLRMLVGCASADPQNDELRMTELLNALREANSQHPFLDGGASSIDALKREVEKAREQLHYRQGRIEELRHGQTLAEAAAPSDGELQALRSALNGAMVNHQAAVEARTKMEAMISAVSVATKRGPSTLSEADPGKQFDEAQARERKSKQSVESCRRGLDDAMKAMEELGHAREELKALLAGINPLQDELALKTAELARLQSVAPDAIVTQTSVSSVGAGGRKGPSRLWLGGAAALAVALALVMLRSLTAIEGAPGSRRRRPSGRVEGHPN